MDTVFFGRKAEKNAEGTPINDIDYPPIDEGESSSIWGDGTHPLNIQQV